MGKIVLAVMALTLAEPAVAANWVYATKGGTSGVFYIDTKSKRIEGSHVNIWVKDVLAVPDKDGVVSKLTLERYDCAQRSREIISEIDYSAIDSVVWSGDYGVLGPHIHQVAPDTIGEALYNVACR